LISFSRQPTVRNFRVHFVRGNFKERLVALTLSPGFFSHLVIVPSKMLPHLGHYDVYGHFLLLRVRFFQDAVLSCQYSELCQQIPA